VNRNALKQFLKKMKFTLTIDEALASKTCMTVFNAYCANIVQDQKSTKPVESLVTKKEKRPRTFLSKTGNRSSATQHESYEAIKTDLGERQLLVLQFVKDNPGYSRAELTALINRSGTPIRHSSVTGRCSELLSFGLIKKAGIKFDETTKRNVEILEAAA
jgi:hypothetical protein